MSSVLSGGRGRALAAVRRLLPAGVAGRPGFTAIEMLVVLILVALVTVLLMQGFSETMTLRFRFIAFLERQRLEQLHEFWFREVVSYLTPDFESGGGTFAGNERMLTGLTLSALGGPIGAPKGVSLTLVPRDARVYMQYAEQSGVSWELGSWPAIAGRFSYLAPDGEWYPQWPPETLQREQFMQLPVGILLEIDDVRRPVAWFVSIEGRREPWKDRLYTPLD